MYTASQSLYIRGSAGDPLPQVWKAVEQTGSTFRRGQLVLCCAAPGIGKSAFMLSYALRSKVPTLYFSADSDAFTQSTRSLSILTGWPQEKSIAAVMSDNLEALSSNLDGLLIRYNYSASPSIKAIEDTMMAYDALYEDYPALVIIDNITNVITDSDDGDPFSGLEGLMDYLHTMARNTGACVIGLHHVTGPYNDGDKPIPLSGIKGQIGRVPEMIITLHRTQDNGCPDTLKVATVKNRGGKSDPSGFSTADLQFDGRTMQITDYGG